jgi:PPK2 family polyphosphate:nucleotide phosphotransferase
MALTRPGFNEARATMFPAIDLGGLERYRVRAGDTVKLTDSDPRDHKGLSLDKAAAKAATKDDIAEIDRLQEILYAQAKHALLIVLQGMDASGKDGAVRDVFGRLSPMGIVATSFKKPTAQELAHDFLWRVHQAAPPRRMIAVFNRSHYEDVLIARVHRLVPPERIEARYDAINAFESLLADNDTTVVKFFLHISPKEQARRLKARLKDPTKHWKLGLDDLAERKLWDDYMAAYEIALARCSTTAAPWFIVPADRKWYRDAVIARIMRRTLEGLDLAYPPETPEPDKVRIT